MMDSYFAMSTWQVVYWAVSLLLWVIPTWRILGRAGNVPALALLGLIPIVGVLIVLFVIAYGRWPRFENRAGA
jgi:hypothetical protein